MIRTVVTPTDTDLHIAIPKDYVGKQVEVLLYTTDEPMQIPAAETVDIEAYNKEIDDAMKRIDGGNFTTQEDLEKEMESW